MEDDLNYSTVVFRKNNNLTLAKERENEEAIYVEVNVPNQNPATPEEEKPPSHPYPLRLVAVGVGIICLFLGSIIIALCYIDSVSELNARLKGDLTRLRDNHTSQLNANRDLLTLVRNLSSAGEILQNDYDNLKSLRDDLTSVHRVLRTECERDRRERTNCERLRENLTLERDGLGWTLGFIFHFDNFPVQAYCPRGDENGPTQGRKCKPCPEGWILFRSSCYWVSHKERNTWVKGREDCKKRNSDLAVIGSQEEQEFINRNIWWSRVYWIGLHFTHNPDQWVWVDGSKLVVNYWTATSSEGWHKYASTWYQPEKTHWNKESSWAKNYWICETKAMKKRD